MQKRYKVRLPVKELFKFFGLDKDAVDVKLNRYVGIKTANGSFTPIRELVTKRGQVSLYKLSNGTQIVCDERHLVKTPNNQFCHIQLTSELITTDGVCTVVDTHSIGEKRVYDFALDAPHEYITSAGVLCHNTTAAKILVKNIDCDYMFINASDERGIDTMRDKVKSFASTVGFKPLKIIVLDEMDAVTPDGQRALRNMMEAYSATTRFILTANYVERIIEPLVSRAQVYKLTPPSKKDVAKKLADILKNENVEYDTKTVVQIVNAYYPDIRRSINAAQLQTQNGKLQISIDELIGQDIKLKIIDVITSNLPLKDRIKEIRQIVADNQVQDFTSLYQLLYEHVEIYAANKIPQAIIAIADGQYKSAFVVDQEINFVATLYTILTS